MVNLDTEKLLLELKVKSILSPFQNQSDCTRSWCPTNKRGEFQAHIAKMFSLMPLAPRPSNKLLTHINQIYYLKIKGWDFEQ